MKKLNKQVKGFQGQDSQLEQARGRVTSLQEAHKLQVMQIEGKESELNEVKMTVNNLQRALVQKGEECDEMAQSNEKQLSKHKVQVNQMENQIEEARHRLEQVAQFQARISELEADTEGQAQLRASLESERDEMKLYASELVEKVKNEVEGKEFMIDRRMINTFLVQYLNPKSDATTK